MLRSTAQQARASAGNLAGLGARTGGLGDNQAARGVAEDVARLARALENAAGEVETVAGTARVLAERLTDLQAQGARLGAGPQLFDVTGSIAYQNRVDGLRNQARTARAAAASAIRESAQHRVLTGQQQRKRPWDYATSFGKGVWDGGAEFAGGIFQTVTNPAGFVTGLKDLGSALVTNPGGTGKALYETLVDPDLLKKDPARWLGQAAVTVGTFFIPGGGVAKVTGKTGKVAEAATDAARAGETAAGVGGAVAKTLSATEQATIRRYTGADHLPLNHYLRVPDAYPGGNAELDKFAGELSSALQQLPAEPGISYRGTNLSDELRSTFRPGEPTTDEGFLSTTRNPNRVFKEPQFNGNTFIVVVGRNGHDVAPFSHIEKEAEILFDRGTQFDVLSNRWSEGLNKWVITMEEK
ncbi:ADP-ribosyltransferase [Actinoplanes sp. NPDC026619]|uniref:ADP-ribosyltransferase n=1 Tax=Actinoplanes sp. NPDC026619 TaxID=3155798 RepID=UPI0033EFF71E